MVKRRKGRRQGRDGRRKPAARSLLYRAAGWVADRFPGIFTESASRQLQEEISVLSGGKKDALREYQICKCAQMILAFGLALPVLMAALIWNGLSARVIPGGLLVRPGYQEEDEERELEVVASPAGEGDGEESGILTVTVKHREYTDEQAEELLDRAEKELEEVFLGENESPDEVRRPLVFPETLQSGSVKAEWMTTPYGVIGEDGSIREEAWEESDENPLDGEAREESDGETPDGEAWEESDGETPDGEAREESDGESPGGETREEQDEEASEGESSPAEEIASGEGRKAEEGFIVELQVQLTCQRKRRIREMAVRVLPPVLDEEELFWKEVDEALKKADQDTAARENFILPDQVEGRTLSWMKPGQGLVGAALLLVMAGPVFLWFRQDQKVHDRAEKRRQQLVMDYADLMWKLAMLLGAGMTVRGAFFRIADQYRREKRQYLLTDAGRWRQSRHVPDADPLTANRDAILRFERREGGRERYVYEEILYTCNEMSSGIPETQTYENFGRRCGSERYVKLGTFLSQNIQKGAKGLTQFLEREAADSMEERKNLSRKLGETAGTKLLFPMILMLGTVMVILMVPAFMAM